MFLLNLLEEYKAADFTLGETKAVLPVIPEKIRYRCAYDASSIGLYIWVCGAIALYCSFRFATAGRAIVTLRLKETAVSSKS